MTQKRRPKVIVGLSGGVDSTVSAWLLKRLGYEVEAIFMKNWDEDDGTEYCTAREDFEYAMRVSQQLDIPLQSVSFSADYWDRVFAHFLAEYKAGRTPNPDILCNREIKFRAFLDHAVQLGADFIATGHYAQRCQINGVTSLVKGVDPQKDQSYFLHAVEAPALAKALFPLGGLCKQEVRKLAAEQGFVNHRRKDSTGICFIGERRFRDFLQTYLPAQPGPIVTLQGQVLGEHQGLMYHTLGQRQGLRVGGVRGQPEAPWYVAEKRMADNSLVVVQGADHPALFHQTLYASGAHWFAGMPPEHRHCTARIRYRQADQGCRIEAEGALLKVVFDQPQRAITPGQAVVFYQGAVCLGGATIESAAEPMLHPEMSEAQGSHRIHQEGGQQKSWE